MANEFEGLRSFEEGSALHQIIGRCHGLAIERDEARAEGTRFRVERDQACLRLSSEREQWRRERRWRWLLAAGIVLDLALHVARVFG